MKTLTVGLKKFIRKYLLKAAQKLFEKSHKCQFLLLQASSIPLQLVESILKKNPKNIPIEIYNGPTYDGIQSLRHNREIPRGHSRGQAVEKVSEVPNEG